MDNYKRVLRRVLALAVAVTTITTAGSQGLLSMAATYGGLGTDTTRSSNLHYGSRMAQAFYIEPGQPFQQLTDVSFNIYGEKNQTINFNLKVYGGFSDPLNPDTWGTPLATVNNASTTVPSASLDVELGVHENVVAASEPINPEEPVDPESPTEPEETESSEVPVDPENPAPVENPETSEPLEATTSDSTDTTTTESDEDEDFNPEGLDMMLFGMPMLAAELDDDGDGHKIHQVDVNLRTNTDFSNLIFGGGTYFGVVVEILTEDKCMYVDSGSMDSQGNPGIVDVGYGWDSSNHQGIFSATTTTDSVSEPNDVTSVSFTDSSNLVYDLSELGGTTPADITMSCSITPANRTIQYSSSNGSDFSGVSLVNSDNTQPKIQLTNPDGGQTTITAEAKTNSAKFDTKNICVVHTILTPDGTNEATDYPFTGSAVEPVEVVKCGSATLVKDTDYTVTYDDNINAGTATATFTLKGSYPAHTYSLTYRITAADLTSTDFDSPPATFSVDSTTNAVTVTGAKHGSFDLVQDRDFTARLKTKTVETNSSITYVIDITGKGNFKSTTLQKSVNVTASNTNRMDLNEIVTAKVSQFQSDGTTPFDFVYDGTQKEPVVKFYSAADGVTEIASLVLNTDYSLSYNSTNAGDENDANPPKVTVTGIGNYTGTIVVPFSIEQADLKNKTNFEVTLDTSLSGAYKDANGDYFYKRNGTTQIKPAVTVIKKGATQTQLVENSDYTVSYGANNDPDEPGTVIITGKGNYKNKRTINFTIEGNFKDDLVIKVGGVTAAKTASGTYTSTYSTPYTSKEIKPSLVVTMNGVTYREGQDYTSTITNNTNAGTATYTLTEIRKADGQNGDVVTVTFTISPRSLAAGGSMSVVKENYVWDASPINVTDETVMMSGVASNLVKGTDYELSYSSDRTNAGTVTVYANGKGNYTGQCSTTVNIVPLDISDTSLVEMAPIPTQPYTGNPVVPSDIKLIIKANGKEIDKTYYNKTFSNNINVGTQAVVNFTAIGRNITGSTIKNFEIVAKSLGNNAILLYLDIPNQGDLAMTKDSSGNYVAPGSIVYANQQRYLTDIGTLIIKEGGQTLRLGTDYKFTKHANNIDASDTPSAYAEVTGMGNYGGTLRIYFQIERRDIEQYNEITVNGNEAADAYGLIYPKVTIKNKTYPFKAFSNGKVILERGRDYKMEPYDGSMDLSQAQPNAKVIIRGIGNYCGTKEVTYQIGTDLDSNNITVSYVNPYLPSSVYSPNESGAYFIDYLGGPDAPNKGHPKVVLKNNGVVIPEGDYKVDYTSNHVSTNNAHINNAVVVTIVPSATGKGVLYGEREAGYTLNSIRLDSASKIKVVDDSGSNMEYTYNGRPITNFKPKLQVDYGDGTFRDVPVSEYTLDTSKLPATLGLAVNAAGWDADVVASSSNGNFTGSTSVKVKVNPKNIDDTIGAQLTYTYDQTCDYNSGQPVKPAVTIVDSESGQAVTLRQGTDYTISYSNNTAITAVDAPETSMPSFTVTGIGNYTGTCTKRFAIQSVNLSDAEVTVPYGIYRNGEEIKFAADTIVVKKNDKILRAGTDYDITYSNNRNVGSNAQVTITGKDKYTGSKTVNFTIKANIADTAIFTVKSDYAADTKFYIGDSFDKTKFHITYKEKDATTGADTGNYLPVPDENWEINDTDITDTGTRKLYLEGKDLAMGSAVYTVDILAKSSNLIIMPIPDQAYTGSVVAPNITVRFSPDGDPEHTTKTLVKGADYEIQNWDNNTDAGKDTASVTVKGLDTTAYAGTSVTRNFTIYYDLSDQSTTVEILDKTDGQEYQMYTGAQIKPNISVTTKGKVINLTDCFVTYGSNISIGPGTGTIVVSGSNGSEVKPFVRGTVTKSFDIKGNDFGSFGFGATLSSTASEVYTGDPVKPTVVVKDKTNSVELQEGRDYALDYTNNVDVTTNAQVRIVGIGRYTNSVASLTFSITKKNLNDPDVAVTVADAYFIRQDAEVTPKVTVKYNNRTLVEGTDYTLTYGNNKTVGTQTATVQITPLATSNFDETSPRSVLFDIKQTPLNSAWIHIGKKTMDYDGSDMTAKADIEVIAEDGNPLQKKDAAHPNGDYTLTISPAKVMNKGTYTVTVVGVNGYTATITDTLEVTARSLDTNQYDTARNPGGIKIEVQQANDYKEGQPVKADVLIKDYGLKNEDGSPKYPNAETTNDYYILKPQIDYTVTYKNNTKSMSATDENPPTAVITGIGNYQGVVEETFNIGVDITGGSVFLPTLNSDPTAQSVAIEYDGKVHKPSITSVRTAANAEIGAYYYDATYYSLDADGNRTEDFISAGKKYIEVRGKNGYYGTIIREYEILPRTILDNTQIHIILCDPKTGQEWPKMTKEGSTEQLYYTQYTGQAIEPVVRVYDDAVDKVNPIDPSEYTVGFKTNTNKGDQATVEVTFIKDYKYNPETSDPNHCIQTVAQLFVITGQVMTDANGNLDSNKFSFAWDSTGIVGTGDGRYLYTGQPIEPVPVIEYDNGVAAQKKTLIAGVDFKVIYDDDHINAGRHTMTIKALDENFTGEFTKDFVIYATLDTATLPDGSRTLPTQFFTGKEFTVDVPVLRCGGNLIYLEKGDYSTSTHPKDGVPWTVADEGYVAVSEGTNEFYVAGEGGGGRLGFSIRLDSALLKVGENYDKVIAYDGLEHKQKIEILAPDGTVMDYDPDTQCVYRNTLKDGTVVFGDCKSVGTISAIISLNVNGQTGVFEATYEIIPRDFSTAAGKAGLSVYVLPEVNRYIMGQAVKPTVALYANNNKIQADEYTVTYTMNCDQLSFIGENPPDNRPWVIITGNNDNFTGEMRVPYVITPVRVYDLKEDTAKKTATSVSLKWGWQTSVDGYRVFVYDKDGKQVGQPIYRTGYTNNSVTITGLNSGEQYTFAVESYVNSGNNSKAYSHFAYKTSGNLQDGDKFDGFTVLTTATAVPSASISETVSTATATASIKWDPTNTNVTGYEVWRYTSATASPESGTLVASRLVTDGGHTDSKDLESGKTYYYRIRAYKLSGGMKQYSAYSQAVQITVK